MANQLKVAVVHAIEVLLERGWSQRRIAAALGVDRGTVARYAGLGQTGPPGAHASTEGGANPAKAPPGTGEAPPGSNEVSTGPGVAPTGVGDASSGTAADPEPATQAPPGSTTAEVTSLETSGGVMTAAGVAEAPPGSLANDDMVEVPSRRRPASQTSKCEPFREVIQGKLNKGLAARRIHQDLVLEHGFAAKYHSVRRFVQRLGRTRPLPFRRMECAPGDEAQVDFGTGAPILLPNGKRRRPHVFRIVLSHSRKGYSEAVLQQSTESFIGALENAFRHFGGVPKTLVVDNLKAAVIKVDWFDPDLNPKIQAFSEHYGTVILPTKPRMPRHKGKVEAGVKYVQSNGLSATAVVTPTKIACLYAPISSPRMASPSMICRLLSVWRSSHRKSSGLPQAGKYSVPTTSVSTASAHRSPPRPKSIPVRFKRYSTAQTGSPRSVVRQRRASAHISVPNGSRNVSGLLPKAS